MRGPLKILVAEDQPALRQHAAGLAANAACAHGDEVEIFEADNGAKAVANCASIKPDFVILDVAMPELNGIKAAGAIWKDFPTMKILFWSQYHLEAYIRELGKIVPDEAIHGYVLKSVGDSEVLSAIEHVLYLDLPFIAPQVEEVSRRLKDKTSAITDLEYETLLDIALGLTDKAIARKEHISYRGAQNRLSTLLNKLVKGEDAYLRETAGIEIYNPRTRLITEALRRGLIASEDLERHNNEHKNWLFSEFGYQS
jgi:DNA-binding NarL/FixJ family response regulator